MISSWAIKDLLDNRLRFTEPGMTTYLRTLVTDVKQGSAEFEEYGFQVPDVKSDVVDIEITPPASVAPVSMHNIGLNETRLEFGAHRFDVSHSFVEDMMESFGVDNGYGVWRHPSVVGIVYNGSLFSLESIVPLAVGGEIIRWTIVGNQKELPPTRAFVRRLMLPTILSSSVLYPPSIG